MCPAEKVPEGFSSIGAKYSHDPYARVIIFVMENLQQTAEQVRVNIAGVILYQGHLFRSRPPYGKNRLVADVTKNGRTI